MSEEVLQEMEKLKAENAALQLQLKTSETQVCKVAAKIPPFWPHKPAIWFATVEAQFEIAGITADSTKYNYLIGNLDQKYALEVEDIIIKPPAIGEKYKILKEELIKRLSMTEEQRVRQLISDEKMGDSRPSQFLRHLQSLAGSTFNDLNMIRQLWLRRLPNQIQAILATQMDLTLEKLAELADKVLELTGSSNVYGIQQVAVAHSSSESTNPQINIEQLQHSQINIEQQVAGLTQQVAALTMQQQRHSRSISRSRGNSPIGQKLYWYHKRFRSKATKCVNPCTWMSLGNSSHNQ